MDSLSMPILSAANLSLGVGFNLAYAPVLIVLASCLIAQSCEAAWMLSGN